MILRIARHELRDIVRDGRFRWSATFVAGLLGVALLTGWTYQRGVSAEHASAERLVRETWLNQPSKDPHTAAHYGGYAFKPRGPLTLFDSGVNQYAGVATFLEAHKQNEFQFRPAQDRAAVARLGQLTAAATLQHLVPILIVLLVFTKFAGERETGTLRQLASTGVSPRILAAGKAAGVCAALALILIPSTIAGVCALMLASGTAALGGVTGRVAALTLVYGCYFAVFLTVGLAVSTAARRSSHALAILIAFWVLNGVVAPRAAADLSRSAYPTPTAFEFGERVYDDTYDHLQVHEYNLKRAPELRDRLLREYRVARVEDLPVNFRGMDYLDREAHANQIWETHYKTLWSAFERQTAIHHRVGWVAPMMAVRELSMALAGVDFFHHREFAAAAEAYRRRLVLAMNSQLAYGGGSAQMGSYTAQTSLWATVAPFIYRQPHVGWALSNVRTSIAALAVWLVAAVAALLTALRRMAIE